MSVLELSSDFGLRWGNYTLTPPELASLVDGIDVIDGLLVFDGVKFVNRVGHEYLVDRKGQRHEIAAMMEGLISEALH